VLLPALHAFLGLSMLSVMDSTAKKASEEVGKQQLAEAFVVIHQDQAKYMPVAHRDFLEDLEKPNSNMRRYCLKRFGQKGVPVERIHNLEVAYNEGMNALTRFLSRRNHLVGRMFPRLSSSFRSLHSEVVARMLSNRLQLLKMRQRAYLGLEP